jgi:small redox-active disulfide protein 2
MEIKVVGPGCARCKETEKRVINACAELNLAADITHVTEIIQFAGLGVMFTPGVVINGQVVVQGRIPEPQELKSLLTTYAANEKTPASAKV